MGEREGRKTREEVGEGGGGAWKPGRNKCKRVKAPTTFSWRQERAHTRMQRGRLDLNTQLATKHKQALWNDTRAAPACSSFRTVMALVRYAFRATEMNKAMTVIK